MRIISLCPSTTETVFALGRGADLVAVTKFCVHPVDRVRALEKVGGTKDPQLGRIIALAPDLVLMNEEENRQEDAENLLEHGLRLHTSLPRSVAEVIHELRELGRVLHASESGETYAARLTRLSNEVRERVQGRRPVRLAYLIWRKPWMAVGTDTYIDDLLTQAGAENIFSRHPARYPEIDPEAVAAADAVLLSSEPFPFQHKHIEELSRLSGLSPERFRLVDGEDFSWHGARTLRGLAEAERIVAALSAPG